jgi:hypothetical protein
MPCVVDAVECITCAARQFGNRELLMMMLVQVAAERCCAWQAKLA